MQGSILQPPGFPLFLRVCLRACSTPTRLSVSLAQNASVPDFAAVAPISHLVPTHTGWVMYTLCADVQGGVHIHMGYRSYIHCAYIYTHIYIQHIYIFLHSYIYCTEHSPSTKNSFVTSHGLSSEILTPGQKLDWNEGLIQTGMGTEDRTLSPCHTAGPIPDVSTPLGKLFQMCLFWRPVYKIGLIFCICLGSWASPRC